VGKTAIAELSHSPRRHRVREVPRFTKGIRLIGSDTKEPLIAGRQVPRVSSRNGCAAVLTEGAKRFAARQPAPAWRFLVHFDELHTV